MTEPAPDPRLDSRHDAALQAASRFMSLVKSGRAYPAGHVGFTRQLEQYLALLEPVLFAEGHARFDATDGELRMNGERLPFRHHTHRALEQLVQELAARAVDGVEFMAGVTVQEFQAFMELFLLGERWKGQELITACHGAGITHVRAMAQRSPAVERTSDAGGDSLRVTLGRSHAAWVRLFAASQALLSGDALDQGIELRHLKRIAQPLVDAVLAGERILAALARISPGESMGAHAAHTALTAVGMGVRLGLCRAELADIAVAALLHDVGHGWLAAGAEHGGVAHTHEGVRRIAWATTLNATSLAAMRTALEHHGADGVGAAPALQSRLVGAADAYVTLLSRGATPADWLSPEQSLARVLERLRAERQPALALALVRTLGCHPPGQLLELDDGGIVRALVPVAEQPERPWVQYVADARGMLIPSARREATPLADERHIVRALPRDPRSMDETVRPAA